MPYNAESVLLDFIKKSLESIVSYGGFFNSSQPARLFLDTLFSSGFFGVAFGNIFWCARFFWLSQFVRVQGIQVCTVCAVCTVQLRYIQIAYFAFMCVQEYTHTTTGATRNMPHHLSARTKAIFAILCFFDTCMIFFAFLKTVSSFRKD